MTVGDAKVTAHTAAAGRKPVRIAGLSLFSAVFCVALAAGAASVPAQEDGGDLPLPLPAVTGSGEGETAAPAASETGRLGDAFQQMKAQNPVVARVNGHEIRWAAVMESAGDLPARYRDQLESVFPALLDRLVDVRLLADEARGRGLQDDQSIREQVAAYEDRLLSNLLLERYLEDRITTAAVRKRYDAMVVLRRSNLEVRARHILVESEEEAAALIAKLDGGAVFPTLALEHSIGPSRERGGDLGYFFSRRMAPAFAAALNELEPGSYTASPVETAFGWHVILLIDRRDDDIPSFIDMQAQLREELTKESVAQLVAVLRRQALVEMFPEDTAAQASPTDNRSAEDNDK